MSVRPRVVIIGSGFGGLSAVRHLDSVPVEVTVVDRDNYHGFWPLLYQVATAALGSDSIAHPIRGMLAIHRNVRIRVANVTGVDLDERTVHLDGEPSLDYDYLIVAAGSSSADFGIPGVRDYAFPLKTLPDAIRLRNHVLRTFEWADGYAGALPDGALTFLLVGGGPTGVEMAGAMSELIRRNLANDFRHLDVTQARVILVEMNDHLLPGFHESSQTTALESLRHEGVEVRFGVRLAKVTDSGATFEDGSSIEANTVVWTAGVQANPVLAGLDLEKSRGGTVVVNPDL
ncbi:MAG: NAD(P)/FAD-dependent oxidoreductase, partial [Acidimicrobiales bacterium]